MNMALLIGKDVKRSMFLGMADRHVALHVIGDGSNLTGDSIR